MKQLYDSENVLMTLSSGQEMCWREMGDWGRYTGREEEGWRRGQIRMKNREAAEGRRIEQSRPLEQRRGYAVRLENKSLRAVLRSDIISKHLREQLLGVVL